VLERSCTLACEVSVIVGAQRARRTSTWPVAENRHRDGILDVSDRAARASTPALAARADTRWPWPTRSTTDGVLCVEMFVTTRRRAAGQRDRAAAAQQRPLHDRRLRDRRSSSSRRACSPTCRSATRRSTRPR
jgi:hypothetical protein